MAEAIIKTAKKIKQPKHLLFLMLLVFILCSAWFYFFGDTKNTRAEGGDVTISSASSTPAGEYHYGNITITNNSTWTLQGSTTLGIGVTIYADSITIDSGSSISANGQGYAPSTGPMGGSGNYGSGGGHAASGGYGYQGNDPANGTIYGSLSQPATFGSGGSYAQNSCGTAGGGAIKLIVSGTVSVGGSVTANGPNVGCASYGGGGAGGSIWIDATLISGSGSITATGGRGGDDLGGSGSGGRIAMYYVSKTFNGTVNVAGGAGWGRSGSGGDGTVFYSTQNAFICDKGVQTIANSEINTSIYNNLSVDGGCILTVNGDLNLSGTTTVGNTASSTLKLNGSLSSGNISMNNTSTFYLKGTTTILSTISVNGNSTLNLVSSSTTGVGITVFVNDINIYSGSKISGNGFGYAPSTGPMGGSGAYGSGGGHAASGGAGYQGNDPANGTIYGSVSQPITLGSGGAYAQNSCGTAGGGAIKIIASGTLTVDGSITSDGPTVPCSSYGGGGAGGSIWIDANTLGGSGTISANGGRGGNDLGGGGGGGRIALYYFSKTFSGTISVSGGAAWGRSGAGGTGTIYKNQWGNYTSKVFDFGSYKVLTTLGYSVTTPASTTVSVDLRTGNTATPDGTWSSWTTNISNGGDISSFGNPRYVQYKVNLSSATTTTNNPVSVSLNDITINYDKYAAPTSGTTNVDFNTEWQYIQENSASGTAITNGETKLNDPYIKLLIHADGTGNSFVDSSLSLHTISSFADVTQSSSQYKFGNKSAYFDGTTDYLSVPDSTDWNFGTGDFTIDFWTRFDNIDRHMIVTQQDNDLAYWQLYLENDGNLEFWNSVSGGKIGESTLVLSTDTWYHIALVRNGNQYKMYIDGDSTKGFTATDTNSLPDLGSVLYIGKWYSNALYMKGYIDELRISKGYARWTSDFTPPSSPYGTYPTTQPYYVTTASSTQINTTSWYKIIGISITQTMPANTDIKYLVSFDSRNTWKYYNGSSWASSSLDNLQTEGMSKATIEGLNYSNWASAGGFRVATGTLDFAFDLSSSDNTVTPSVDNIAVSYQLAPPVFISSAYDSIQNINALTSLIWTENLPSGSDLLFQVRTAPDSGSAPGTWTNWVGPDGTSGTFFTIASGTEATPSIVADAIDDRWMQYRVFFVSDGGSTPTLSDVSLNFASNGPPSFDSTFGTNGLDVSQVATSTDPYWNKVKIEYSIKDQDASSGVVTPNHITPTFEYSLNGGVTWNNVLLANVTFATTSASGTVQDINTDTLMDNMVYDNGYVNYIAYWDAKAQISGTVATSAQIRMTIDDNEAVFDTAVATSSLFTMDVKNPTLPDHPFQVDASSTPVLLTMTATDDYPLEMKYSLNNDLSGASWVAYASSTTITLATNPDTVYIQFRDSRGNSSAILPATTPGQPINMMIQDTSNMTIVPNEFRLFSAWKKISLPSAGFNSYKIYRSSDQLTWSLVGTVTDINTNYYGDNTVAGNQLYYYKVTSVDSDYSVSYVSATVSGRANGVQDEGEGGGGTEATPPTISNVATSSVYTTQATIVWDTSELSDSQVDYIEVTGGDFTGAPTVGVNTMLDTTAGSGQHSVTLTGLQPNTTYYYQVKSTDAIGNISTSKSGVDGYSFTTLTGPVISNVAVSEIKNSSARITWTTDTNVDSKVVYSTSTSFTSEIETGNTDLVTDHLIVLSGLTTGTRYYFYVKSDVARDNNSGNYYNFITTYDSDGPIISSVTADPVFDNNAVVNWNTDESATSKVVYGTASDDYASSSENAALDVTHSFALESLSPSTTYYYRVISADANSNTSTSSEYTFTTSARRLTEAEAQTREDTARQEGIATGQAQAQQSTPSSSSGGGVLYIEKTVETIIEKVVNEKGEVQKVTKLDSGSSGTNVEVDSKPPVISNITKADLSANSVIINWQTNEDSDSFVEYGLNDKFGYTFGKREKTKNHSIKLNFLEQQTKYFYRVTSADSSGNISIAISQEFITPSMTEYEMNNLENQMKQIEDLSKAQNTKENDSMLLDAAQKAMEIVNRVASQVSVYTLESTLSSQRETIEKLAQSIPGPFLVGEPKVVTTANTATIAWRTDKDSNSLIAYSPDSEYKKKLIGDPYYQIVGDSETQTKTHIVTIRNLEPDTTYHYQARSKPLIGPLSKSSDFTFKTQKETLEISSYAVQNVSNEKAIFKWVTNIETDASLRYIPYRNNVLSVDQAKTKTDKSVSLIHEIGIDDFEGGTVYQIELSGKDLKGNNTTKVIPTFTTSKDDLAPVIYQVQSDSAISPGKKDTIQTIVSWLTNEPATSRIYWAKGMGKDSDLLTESSQLDKNYSKKHFVVITKFEPGTIYRFQAESTDSTGNTTLSKVYTILTPRQQETVFDVIRKNFMDVFGWTSKVGF